jgi:PQQ-dependent catabolism-associated beta-propeller protein
MRTLRTLFVVTCATLSLAEVPHAQAGRRSESSARGSPRWIVVSNERSHDLTLLHGTTLRVEATIPVGGRARGIRVAPDGRSVLVALSGDVPQTAHPNDGIAVVDLATRRVVRRYKAGTDPEQFAITPNGRRIFAANEDAGTASSIDPSTGLVRATLVVGTEPEGVTASPDGRWVYVTGETSNTISVIDVDRERVVSTFLVDARPRDVAFTRDGTLAYVTSEVGGSVAKVDVRRHRVLARAAVGTGEEKPVGVAVSPDGRRLYVATGGAHSLVALDASTLREVGRVRVGRRPWGVALSPDGRFAYTANGRSDDISVVDTRRMRVVSSVRVGTRPWGVAVVP